LDVFCGEKKFYEKDYIAKSNDIKKSIECDSHLDVEELLDLCLKQGEKYDLVDLDSFGATIQYLDRTLEIATKGIIMTLGELGHRRWKRLDFISKYYKNITKVEDITIENMVEWIIEHSKTKGVFLEVVVKKDWGSIGRVWFKINNIVGDDLD
jgi:hypothetical protein